LQTLLFDLGRVVLDAALQIESDARTALAEGRSGPVILCMEHDPVYTVGRAGVDRHVPAGKPGRFPHVRDAGVPVVEVDRGGDVTWHGPGQLVLHPVLPLKELGITLMGYLRALESSAIEALIEYGVRADCREGLTGTWVGDAKVGFIGIACRKWITYHGLSINVDCDLSAFSPIVPCGIADCRVTSLAELLPSAPPIEELGERVAAALARRLGLELRHCAPTAREVSCG
jgi:lipoyl(octanoyl) transferase